MNSPLPLRLSYGYAALLAASLGYFLLRIPIQVTDSFTNILALDRSFWAVMTDMGVQPGYLRPGLWAELKLVYDLSGGDLFTWFRWTQVLQVAATLLLFVRLLAPRTITGALALPLALAVLVGSHTFAWTVREAFPINTFLTIVFCCVAAATLSFGEYRRWRDAAAVAIALVAAFTVESGLLVPVIVVAAWLTGAVGVSRRGVAGVVLVAAGYLALRFLVLSVGMPALDARDAGFGFSRRDGEEIAVLFGERPWVLYAYNVVSAAVGVLVAEPRDGVWRLAASTLAGRPDIVLLLAAVASTLATAVIVRYAWARRRAWRARAFERGDRIVLVFVAVLAANAVLSYAYTKDVIMSPAGLFYAAAFHVACHHLLETVRWQRMRTAAVAVAVLATLSTTWGVRQVGLHAGLAWTAVDIREQWAYIDDYLGVWGYADRPPHVEALRRQLQDDALLRHPLPMPVRDKWTRLFELE